MTQPIFGMLVPRFGDHTPSSSGRVARYTARYQESVLARIVKILFAA